MTLHQKIATCLWFDGNAEEAASFYASLFEDSKILEIGRFTEAGPGPEGSAMIVRFQLAGQEFLALNGGPQFRFSEAISLAVSCETQEEVDELWKRLTEGGSEQPCGWLKDRFGLSWQIVPTAVPRMLQDPDPKKRNRVMEAILPMKKIDIATVERAYAGKD
jgi:predicted 3-demethylubiquinone-9 3-methyltransferase (glyoxalase superfamily)